MDHTNHVPKKEWMAYCVGALGQGMVYAIMSSYISDFYISVLKLTPLFVLLLMLLARVWDAINRSWAILWTTPIQRTAK